MSTKFSTPTVADTALILVCAGNATRMGGIHKILHPLGNETVLSRSLRTFCHCKSVMELVVVGREQDREAFLTAINALSLPLSITFVAGGVTRQESVKNGFAAVSDSAEYVAVHDGARPLVHPEDIERVIHDAHVFGGATLGVPVKDTIKVVEDGLIIDTPYRPSLYITQTPQVFQRTLYAKAMQFAIDHALDFTDDCQLVEAIGHKIAMTTGRYSNLKLTTTEDFLLAEALLPQESLP